MTPEENAPGLVFGVLSSVTHRDINPDDIRDVLSYIPADDRETWIRIGAALKLEFGDAGFGVFDHWSQGSAKYNARDAAAVWRSFRRISGRRTSIGTIIFTAKLYGWRGKNNPANPPELKGKELPGKKPEVKHKPSPSPLTSDTQKYALELWIRAAFNDSCIASHPYAQAKGINWAAGAGRVTASGCVIGRDTDCIIVPIRDIGTEKIVAVQCINSAEAKQTFGPVSGNGFILGNTLDKSLYWYVVEGWASAVSMVFHHYGGNAVAAAAFGKSNLEKLAHRIAEVYQPDRVTVVEEIDA